MRELSISLAWEQTKTALASDGRLLAAVAGALVSLPLAVMGVISPGGLAANGGSAPWLFPLVLIVLLLLMIGQLAMIRLAIGPSVSVGEAIVHGVRRVGFYVLAFLIVIALLFAVALVLALLMVLAGAPMDQTQLAKSPAFAVGMLVFLLAYCFLWVRILALAPPVASAEAVGPIEIVKRSWNLSAGHFWRLFGFLLLFVIAASIAVFALEAVANLVARLLFGGLEPLSLGALLVSLASAIGNGVAITFLTVMLARIYVQISGRESLDVSVPSNR